MLSRESALSTEMHRIDIWYREKWRPFEEYWRWRWVIPPRCPDPSDIVELYRQKRISHLIRHGTFLALTAADAVTHQHRPRGVGYFEPRWGYAPHAPRDAGESVWARIMLPAPKESVASVIVALRDLGDKCRRVLRRRQLDDRPAPSLDRAEQTPPSA